MNLFKSLNLIDGKRSSYKWFLGTWNNPKDVQEDGQGDNESLMREAFADSTYCTWQYEKGENGTPHFQFVCYYAGKKNVSEFKGYPCWIKGVRDKDAQTILAYANKERSRIAGPYFYGKQPVLEQHGKKRDYNTALQLAKEGKWEGIEADVLVPHLGNLLKLAAHFGSPLGVENPRGLWYYGPPGTGKSHAAREYDHGAYIKELNKWWDNYSGQSTVILDDFDHQGSCLGHHLKIWLDKYAIRGEIKHGSVALRYTTFILTSNYLPEDIWPSDQILCQAIRRRCTFHEFTRSDDPLADANRKAHREVLRRIREGEE